MSSAERRRAGLAEAIKPGVIADALRAAGVRYAFTVPGESFLGLLDGLRDAGIRVVATRHEGGAAFMAEAYGQLTGRPAACVGTRAVGAANLAIGIHTARQNSTPMFALVGQVQRAVSETIGDLTRETLALVGFAALLFYALTTIGIFVLRRARPVA